MLYIGILIFYWKFGIYILSSFINVNHYRYGRNVVDFHLCNEESNKEKINIF